MKKITFICSLFLIEISILNATVLIDPTTQGGFESGSGFVSNGWTVVNGAPSNKWWCNTPANPASPFAGTNCAYISNNGSGTTYNYVINQTSVVHFYRDITIPAGEPIFHCLFTIKDKVSLHMIT